MYTLCMTVWRQIKCRRITDSLCSAHPHDGGASPDAGWRRRCSSLAKRTPAAGRWNHRNHRNQRTSGTTLQIFRLGF